jgi:hypothetical protein
MNSRCNIGATRRGRGALANAPDLRGEDQIRGGLMGSQERAKEPPRKWDFERSWTISIHQLLLLGTSSLTGI